MASLIQKVDSDIRVLSNDFIRNFEEGLTSVEIILTTLSETNLERKDEVKLKTIAFSIEKYFKEAVSKLDAIINYFRVVLIRVVLLLVSDKELVESIDNLAQSIKEEGRNIENFRNQLAQSEKEKDIAERRLLDTLEDLMNLERRKNSIPLRAAASGTLGILVGTLLLGPLGGALAVGINGAAAVAEISSLNHKVEEYKSHFKSQVDTISDLHSKIHEAKVKMFAKEIKILVLGTESGLSKRLLEKNKENSRNVTRFKETLKQFTNSISRIHGASKVVSIESQEIYELKSLINSLLELGTAIETVLPGYGISNRLEDLSKQANTCKMLESEFSF